MNLSSNILALFLISSSALGFNQIAEDNKIAWLNSNQSLPFTCGNDNCEILGAQGEGDQGDSGQFILSDAVIKYYTFENFSDKLTPEMESAFDAFVFVNTSENQSISCGQNPLKIPSQFGRIIWKNKHVQQPVFIRSENNKILDVNTSSIQIVPGLDESFFDGRKALDSSVTEFLYKNRGLNYFPVSTGTIRNVAKTMTPSGIFAIDFDYTSRFRNRTEANPYEHMPNTILADAVYGANYANRKFAFGIHGTPEYFVNCKKSFPNGLTINQGCPPCPVRADIDLKNLPANCINTSGEKALGIKRDSAGCIRTYTPTSRVIAKWAWNELVDQAVPQFNPNINIPTGPLSKNRRPGMKILIIPFSGYDSSQTCQSL